MLAQISSGEKTSIKANVKVFFRDLASFNKLDMTSVVMKEDGCLNTASLA